MNTKKRLFASALLIGLAATGVLISGSHNVAKAGPGAAPVSIVSPVPLPITGTATVSGTVGAVQSGAWNVGITGTPSVNVGTPTVSLGPGSSVGINGSVAVGNTSANPVPILDTERVARIPYASTSEVNCGVIPSVCDFNTFAAPPTGFRLIAQNISGFVRLSDTALPFTLIRQQVNANHFLAVPASISTADGLNSGIINQTIVGYFSFAPDVTVAADFGTSFTSELTISGYLENCSITGCPSLVGQ